MSAPCWCITFSWSCPQCPPLPELLCSVPCTLQPFTTPTCTKNPGFVLFPSVFPLSRPELMNFWVVAEPSTALFPALTQRRFSSQEKNTLRAFMALCTSPTGCFPLCWVPSASPRLSQLPGLSQHPEEPGVASTGVSHPYDMSSFLSAPALLPPPPTRCSPCVFSFPCLKWAKAPLPPQSHPGTALGFSHCLRPLH